RNEAGGCADRDQKIDLEREKLSDERRDFVDISLCVSLFENEVLSDQVSFVGQPLTESSAACLAGALRTEKDVTHPRRNRRLLCPRRDRPGCRGGNKSKKHPSPHARPFR